MLNNYFKVALRALRQNKSFSGLNILGLSLGIACSLLILLWVQDERSVDGFHANNNRLYVLYERGITPDKVDADYENPAILGDELKKTIPDVGMAVSIDGGDDFTFRGGDKTIKAKGGYAGADFFTMFTFPVLQGNPATALSGPADIAISNTLACKLFGSAHAAMGQTVRRDLRNQWKNFTVKAVFDDMQANSSLQFEFLINWQAFYEEHPWMKAWDNAGPMTIVLLNPNANPAGVATKLRHSLDKYDPRPIPGYHIELMLQPFDEMYLHGNFKNGYISGGRIEYIRLFTLVAIFLLLIACINYMNLTTARSMRRAREIGVRKVIGATKGSLIGQFMSEAILLTTLAMAVGLIAVWLLLPSFNSITGKQIHPPFDNATFWLEAAGLCLLIGCLAGSYPALYLSSFRPVAVLKTALRTGTGAVLFRKGLVVFQFTLSILLIIGTIVITRQVKYIQTMNLGYDREALLSIPLEGNLTQQYTVFKEQALHLQGIQQITSMSEPPTDIDNGTSAVDWAGKPANFQPSISYAVVGYDFTKTMKAQLLAGRDFSPSFPTDTTGFIVNREAATVMGMRDPIGRQLHLWDRKGKIIGVIRDLHFGSAHGPIQPLILLFKQQIDDGHILVRIKPGQTAQALAGLKQLCRQLNPAFPFTYEFSDDAYRKLYQSETVIGTLSNYFAFLAILISCLGLLGLAIFTAEQRTKEIGIRKVLGAGTGRLFILLARDFLLLVLLAFVIASPVAAWAMQRWLEGYAYHAPLSLTIFVVAGLLAFLIALLTVGYHAVRAALANPVESLRAE
jgi:putative ABC transport system permease protein